MTSPQAQKEPLPRKKKNESRIYDRDIIFENFELFVKQNIEHNEGTHLNWKEVRERWGSYLERKGLNPMWKLSRLLSIQAHLLGFKTNQVGTTRKMTNARFIANGPANIH